MFDIDKFFYFIFINGEVHFLEHRDEPVEDAESYFEDRLNEEFLIYPNWEAVGVVCGSDISIDQRELRTYVPPDLMYDVKKKVRPTIYAELNRMEDSFPAMKETFVEIPPEHFPTSCFVTYGRDGGTWRQKSPIPVERAVVASRQSSDEMSGWGVELDEDGFPYVEMDVEDDLFLFLTSHQDARSIDRDGKISRDPPIRACSIKWGEAPKYVDFSPSHAHQAVLFRTDCPPDLAHPDEGVVWDCSELEVEVVDQMDASSALRVRNLDPLPSLDELRDRIDEDIANRPCVLYSGGRQKESRKGDPCEIIDNIEEARLPDMIKEDLKREIWEGDDLENDEASMIYSDRWVSIRGRLFSDILLNSHAQYRMDQRGIEERDVKEAVRDFREWFRDKKQNPRSLGHQGRRKLEKLKTGETARYESETGLTIIISLHHGDPGKIRLVTVFWTGVPDPQPPEPGECKEGRVARRFAARQLEKVDDAEPPVDKSEDEEEDMSSVPEEWVSREDEYAERGFFHQKLRS